MFKKLTTEEFIRKAILKHGFLFDYSKSVYLGTKDKICIICLVHGEFWQSPNDHLNGAGCPKCKSDKIVNSNSYSQEEIVKKFIEVHGELFDYSKVVYINSWTKVCITCRRHGDFEQTPANHLKGQGCPLCNKERLKINHPTKSNTDDFIKKSNIVHNFKFDYSLSIYINCFEKICIICPIHGEFWQVANEHLKGCGCPKCKASKGELSIKAILDKYGIFAKTQYRIPDENYLLWYDFYLPELKTVIEFHGRQHYEFIPYFHKTLEGFKEQQDRDAFKIELASKKHLLFIEINYKLFEFLTKDQFEELLIKKINERKEEMQLVKTYVDIGKLVIWGDEAPEADQKRPRLVFGFRDGNPRITVYTGVPGQNGLITFPSDYPTMVACMNMLKDVIAGAPGTKFSIDSLGTVYENNKPTKDKRVVGTLYMGKSKDGIIYFSVMAEGKPKLVFSVKPSPYHVFRDGDKNVIPDSVMSCKLANGIADLVLDIIGRILEAYTAEEYSTVRKPAPIKGQQDTATKGQAKTADFSGELDDLGL